MAVTWTAVTPHSAAIDHILRRSGISSVGVGAGYDANVTDSVFVDLAWVGNKLAVLTKLSASGTYTNAGGGNHGDAAPLPAIFGLKEIHDAFIVASPATNILPVVDGQAGAGIPTIAVNDATSSATTTAPKVQYFDDGAAGTNGTTLTGDAFHVILVGV